jgi:hypothetical protein
LKYREFFESSLLLSEYISIKRERRGRRKRRRRRKKKRRRRRRRKIDFKYLFA